MTHDSRHTHRLYWSVAALLTIALWVITRTKSGYTIGELLMFAGPGIVLSMAASWSSRMFDRDQWTWTAGMRALLIGGLIAPPLIGFGLVFLSAMNHEAALLIFILGAWLSLAGGLFVACIRALRDDFRVRQPAPPVRLELHRPSASRSRHSLRPRAGRRPPWVEFRSTTQTRAARQRPSA